METRPSPSTPDKPSELLPTRSLDRRRSQLLWLCMGLVGLMTLALVLLVTYGLGLKDADQGELLLLIGLLALITCTVAYFADKEREQRRENQRLIQRLHDTATALDARVARLNKLCETSVGLAGTLEVNQISELVVSALVEQVHADAASLVLVDKSKGQYIHTHSTGPLADAGEGPADPVAIAAAAAEEGPAIREVNASPELAEHLRAWEKVRASITAPVKITEVVGGALAAIREERFEVDDLNLLTTLANMSGKAIESAELHQRLRKSYYQTLHALARSLAARDPYSASHGEIVTWIACLLAEELHLSAEEVELLRAYTPLHDLGKIGVPDAVLLKTGPLTAEEIEIVRQHTVIGEEIIAPLLPGAAAQSMIRSHHEHWNGAGYPDGLQGECIPWFARIVAVADAYHAMVSHRVYRGARVPFKAVQEIRSMAGVQFDPTVVEALTRLWDRGELARLNMRMGRATESEPVPEVPSPSLPDLPISPIPTAGAAG